MEQKQQKPLYEETPRNLWRLKSLTINPFKSDKKLNSLHMNHFPLEKKRHKECFDINIIFVQRRETEIFLLTTLDY